MREVREKLHPKNLSKTQILIAIGICIILLGLILFTLRSGSSENTTSEQSTTESTTSTSGQKVKTGDTFGLQDSNKPSSICDKLPDTYVEKAVGEKIEKHFASIPDTETAEGTVAGCTFKIAKSDTQILRSIIIVSRTLSDENTARESFDVLGKENAQKIEDIEADEAYLIQGTSQALLLKGSTIITISYSSISDTFSDAAKATTQLAKKL